MDIIIFVVGGLVLIFGYVVFFGAPYVPVETKYVREAFDNLYKVGRSDLVLDLGSGDGRVLREAARRGATAVGYELNPVLVMISRVLCRSFPEVHIYTANMWTRPFPENTTLIYIFGDGRDIRKFAKTIENETERLGRPLYVLSYGFELSGHEPMRKNKNHFLYKIEPIQ